MRFLIVDHAYDEFVAWLYRSRPELRTMSFEAHRQAYFDTLFAMSDFYSHALTSIGHPAEDIVFNNLHAQLAWWQEHGSRLPAGDAVRSATDFATAPPGPVASNWIIRRKEELQIFRSMVARTPLRHLKGLAQPFLRSLDDAHRSLFKVFEAQVAAAKPDVLYIHTVYAFNNEQLATLKRHARWVVGQHAATRLDNTVDFRLYDLIVSSFPPTLDDLRGRGVNVALLRLGFDPRVSDQFPSVARDIDASFVGSLLGLHRSRLTLLEGVASEVPGLMLHGNVTIPVAADSSLRSRIGPALWGRDMFALLNRSKITINHHGDVLPFANNMRLYEATGLGCLLVTDAKDNLGDMFEPNSEVVTYRDAEECIDKIKYYLDPKHETERKEIAAAGQRRTLAEHNYKSRMRELVGLIEKL